MSVKRIFLILTILGALALGFTELNYYPQLSQGDHGRDLYAAQEVLRGKAPYKDFWWVYGPVMPYYYALFYKSAGGTIASLLLGKLVLKIVCAVLFFLAASTAMAPSIACMAALWFAQSQQDFFFTFNHIGGITAQLGILYLLFIYVQQPRLKSLWMTIPLVLLYCLIKINFGLAAMAAVVFTVLLTDYVYKIRLTNEKKKFYLALTIGVSLCSALIYWALLKDLPLYAIRQCMPYFGDDQPHHFPPSMTIPYYFMQHWLTFIHGPINIALGLILHGATLTTIVLLIKKRIEPQRFLLQIAVLGVFFILNFHEFVVSGVWYRSYWSLPFLFMFHFLMMTTAFSILPVIIRRIIWSAFGALMLLGLVASIIPTEQSKIPPRFLSSQHGQVYVGNEIEWTQTVNTVTEFLNANLKDDEQFFALPYDCIYYFLTGKESPTRQLIFFDHIKIPQEQEIEVIKELEAKKVAFVVMSNRIASSETGMGIFGQTNCPLLSQYLNDNYTPISRQGGDWQKEPGWGNNHGVLIFKRK